MRQTNILSVSQLNRFVKSLIEEDGRLSDIYIRGEVSNFVNHYRSGHFYFSLKDDKAAVRAVMFRGYASALNFLPENGMSVLARAGVGVYERDGAYQLYVTDLVPDGAGAMAIAFEQLKAKLAGEGLFAPERKQPLPRYPARIGAVTSQTGAVLQDIIRVLERRWPLAKLILSPAQVQGEGADKSLIRALSALDGKCDVIIIGRGGGSAEDLAAFNSEILARAIASARTPVVSAVGHETDYTICDFVSDIRAPTPSAAAELCTPSIGDISRRLDAYGLWLRRNAYEAVESREQMLDRLSGHPAFRSPRELIRKKQKKLDFIVNMLYNNKNDLLSHIHDQLARRAHLLDSLSPLRVLERGYAAVFAEGKPVQSVRGLSAGKIVSLRLRDGSADAEIKNTTLAEEVPAHGGKKEPEL